MIISVGMSFENSTGLHKGLDASEYHPSRSSRSLFPTNLVFGVSWEGYRCPNCVFFFFWLILDSRNKIWGSFHPLRKITWVKGKIKKNAETWGTPKKFAASTCVLRAPRCLGGHQAPGWSIGIINVLQLWLRLMMINVIW